MKASQLVSLVSLTLALSACGGSNPFKFQSDPLGDKYASLKNYDQPVDSKRLQPTITIDDQTWPKVKTTFGAFFTFKVDVNDPASNIDNPPILGEAENIPSKEAQNINGAAAVECKTKPRSLGDGLWQFTCTFNTKNLENIAKYIKSEQTLDAVFALSATSRQSALSTGEVTAAVPVQFVKDAPTDSAKGVQK